MSDLIPVAETPVAYRAPRLVVLPSDAPTLGELFGFMAEAELRVRSLRMRIRDMAVTARGEETEWFDVALRHPGHARVLRRQGEDVLGRDYDVWVTDGHVVRTFDAEGNTASTRQLRWGVVGAEREDLPPFARLSRPLTALPAESIAETFVHPERYARNVLATGVLKLVGASEIAGRESLVIRSDHPRSTLVLTDRPDHWIEVAVDRATGFLSLLVEHVGEHVSRHAEVTQLEVDPPLGDDIFELHLSSDVRMLY
jgi:hypothetical protein